VNPDSRLTIQSPFALVQDAAVRLKAAGIDNAAFEARELLARALEAKNLNMVWMSKSAISADQAGMFFRLLNERLSRKPLAYVLGEWDFRDFPLSVGPEVLVPRPETEELVDIVLALARPGSADAMSLTDVGTGSGCLAIALAHALPSASVRATDISSEALRVARENARRNGLEHRIEFLEGDLLSPLLRRGETMDGIVANLPYVPTRVLDGLEPEVRHEPREALDGGEDGLALVRRLVGQAAAAVRPGGFLALEIGYDQAERTLEMLRAQGFANVETRRDLSGKDRFVVAVHD
jgi:release factor glutamine methyltransferase